MIARFMHTLRNNWVYLLALGPLFLLLPTGLYMFALPYLRRRPELR